MNASSTLQTHMHVCATVLKQLIEMAARLLNKQRCCVHDLSMREVIDLGPKGEG